MLSASLPAPERYTLTNASANPSTAEARLMVVDTWVALTAAVEEHDDAMVLMPAKVPRARQVTVVARCTVRKRGCRRAHSWRTRDTGVGRKLTRKSRSGADSVFQRTSVGLH